MDTACVCARAESSVFGTVSFKTPLAEKANVHDRVDFFRRGTAIYLVRRLL